MLHTEHKCSSQVRVIIGTRAQVLQKWNKCALFVASGARNCAILRASVVGTYVAHVFGMNSWKQTYAVIRLAGPAGEMLWAKEFTDKSKALKLVFEAAFRLRPNKGVK